MNMLKLKKDRKTEMIRLSHNLSFGITKELGLVLSGVLIFHILFFSLIEIKEENENTLLNKKPLTLAVAYEDDETLVIDPNIELMAKTLIRVYDQGKHHVLLSVNKMLAVTQFVDEAPPLREWLNAFSNECPLFKSAPRYYPEVECRFIGSLTNLSKTNELSPLKAWEKKASRFPCLYEICIEGQSGMIVFSRLMQKGVPKDIAKKAEGALLSLKFPTSLQPMIKGYVEIIVTKAY